LDGVQAPVKNPLRDRVIYVVHGMGEQEDTETAATLRWKIEDAVSELDPGFWQTNDSADRTKHGNRWILPEPYIQDGFWARYDDITWLAPEMFRDLTEKQRLFFNDLWKRRSTGAVRSWVWLLQRGLMLTRDVPWALKIPYAALTVLIGLIALAMLFTRKTRGVLSRYVSDVRLYLSPTGDVEHEIVQRIDHRVGAQFLELLGLDWDFQELPLNKRLYVGRDVATFKEVTWVAHSLGTVISYNVISDILHKCQWIREHEPDREDVVERVETGLSSFVTMGSPLDKIHYLFKKLPDGDPKTVLRPWPEEYLPGGDRALVFPKPSSAASTGVAQEPSSPRSFWTNFYYMSDPVSGKLNRIIDQKHQSMIENIHTTGLHIPGLAHVQYWRDKQIVQWIVGQTFYGFTKHIPVKRRHKWLKALAEMFSVVFWLAAACLVVFAVWLVAFKLVLGPLWDRITAP
jgi:hypothetical protein